MRILVAAVLAIALLPASAVAQEPPGRKSSNVSWLTTLPEPAVVSAHFEGDRMFVSTLKGLSVYDIADPAAPQRIGFLPLPHFENEDVDMDLGRDFVLISNDPTEGKGILYVISVADPANPTLIGQMDTGITDLVIDPTFGFLPPNYGTGHTASCVAVPPVDCRYVYLAGTRFGIDIVDMADPTAPKYATPRNFPAPEATGGLATHDVQFDRAGHALITGAGGTAIYDITNPLLPILLARTDEQGQSDYATDLGADGSTLNDLVHHNSHRLPNSSLLVPDGPPAQDSDVLVITEEDYSRPTCEGAGSVQTWRRGPDNVIRNLDAWPVEIDPARTALCSAHYFDEDGGLIAQGWYEQGTRFLDVTDPTDIREVGYWIPQKNVTWGALFSPTDPQRETVYSLDHPRGIDVLRIDRGAPPDGGPPPDDSGAQAPDLSCIRPDTRVPPGERKRCAGPAVQLPNLAIRIRDRRKRARPGAVLRYRIRVRNKGAFAAEGVRVRVRLARTLAYRRGGRRIGKRRIQFTLGDMAPGELRRLGLRARVKKRARSRRALARARVLVASDAAGADNASSDRTRILRPRGAAAPSAIAVRTAAMPTRSAPAVFRPVRQTFRAVYGLCRLVARG